MDDSLPHVVVSTETISPVAFSSSGGARVIACPSPLTSRRVDFEMPEGASVAEMVAAAGIDLALFGNCHVWLTDREMKREPVVVAREHWSAVRPKAGIVVTLRVAPSGGGGGGKKNPLRTILTLAVVVASFAFAGPLGTALLGPGLAGQTIGFGTATLGSLVGGAAISLVGNLLINAIAPPPKPRLQALSAGGVQSRSSPTLSITGTGNRANRFGPVPRLFGRHLIYPTLAAAPYTEIVGDDQYLRMLFDFGYGPLTLSQFRIGTTPTGNFNDVETEVRQGFDGDAPITLYSNVVAQDSYSLELTQAGGARIVESRDNADEVTGDITFQGLVDFDELGKRQSFSVTIRIEYRLAGSADPWTLHDTPVYTAATDQLLRRGFRIVTPAPGRYELRFTRLTNDSSAVSLRDDSFLSAIRTVEYQAPVAAKGRALVALRIKASGQLNGIIDQFNAIGEAMLPVWDGAAFTAPQIARHPAWAYVETLRGACSGNAVADSRIDTAAFKAWADQAPERTFDAVIDYPGTLFEALRDIAAAGRATYGMRDGKYTVVRDVAQTTPIQHFTPRNSSGFKTVRPLKVMPHAIKARFIDPDSDWSQQERIVYADGYDASTATKFETLSYFGITAPDLVFQDTRYHLAVGVHRPDSYELSCDIDHLVCTRGDLIRASHDVPLWGRYWARIKAVTLSGSDATDIAVDDFFDMVAGKSYVVRIAQAGGGSVLAAIDTVAGSTKTVTFTTPLSGAALPEVGDMVMFGELGLESVELIVNRIRHARDFRATLELIDAAPVVHQAALETIPPYNPQINWPARIATARPAAPAVASVVSDESVLIAQPGGGFQTQVLINLDPRPLDGFDVLSLELKHRLADSGAPWRSLRFRPDETVLSLTGIPEAETVDIRLRYIAAFGQAGDEAVIDKHFVVGQSTPPPDVATLFLSGEFLTWNYPDPPRDFAGFQVRSLAGNADNWAAAAPAHDGLISANQFDIGTIPRGLRGYYVKAVDLSGNESLNAARLVRDLGDPVLANVIETTDLAAAGFPGTVAGGTVNGGVLEADGDGSLYLVNGADLYLADGAALYLPVNFQAMIYTTPWSPNLPQQDDIARLELTVQGNWTAAYRPGTDPLYLPVGGDLYLPTGGDIYLPSNYTSDFAPWPGSTIMDAGFQVVQFQIMVAAGSERGRITALKAIQDAPDIEEVLEDVAVIAAGARLSPVKSYRAIKSVGLTLQDDAGAARTARVFDKNASLGPLIQAFDGSGVGAAATIDAYIQGY